MSAEHHSGRRASGLALLLALLAAAGLMVAMLATPFVLGTGLAAKTTADRFDDLPTDLPDPVLGVDSRILGADGKPLAVLHGAQNRVPVRIEQVPKVMQQAIVDIEDSRFYTHHGVDYKGLARAALKNTEAGGVEQGGSTLTQQYVKNVLLDAASTPDQQQAATGKSLTRKVREARYALALEQRWPKSRILEGYLNIAYFGNNAYGIGAAAQRYFGETVEQLTLPQAAMLAGLVQGPSQYDPLRHPQAAATRRTEVLARMRQLGDITATQEAAARQTLGLHPTLPSPAADPCIRSQAPFFCDYVRQKLRSDPALGSSKAERDHRLLAGGLTIKTSFDPTAQRAAQQAIDGVVEKNNRAAAAEVMVKPGTGEVVAMAVNRDYGTGAGQTTIPLPTSPVTGSGSTFKVFTLTTAVAQGLPLSTSINAPACYVSKIYAFGGANSNRDPANPGASCADGVSNAEPDEAADYTIPRATWQSVNTFYVQLEEKVGVLNVAATARTLGIPAERLAKVGPGDGSLTLGTFPVSPLDMATAYATLAAHGLRCDPKPVASITSPTGQPVAFTGPAPCRQVISSDVADTVTSVLEGVLTNGTGYPNAATIGRPAAGKTGTAEQFSSAWFVGYTPQLSAAVELLDPRGQTGNPLTNITIGGQTYAHVFGGDVPALVWGRSMYNALINLPYAELPTPAPDAG